MKVIHALEPLAKSIFLAGPTPRDNTGIDWRPEAIRILNMLNFGGTVFVPTPREPARWAKDYDDQIHWEWEALDQATVAVFWVPRALDAMPAFTTNVEYGLKVGKGQVVLGFPEDAPKMRYLSKLAERYSIPVFRDLESTLLFARGMCYRAYGSF